MPNSYRPHGLLPTRPSPRPWDFPGKSTRVGCTALSESSQKDNLNVGFWHISFFFFLTVIKRPLSPQAILKGCIHKIKGKIESNNITFFFLSHSFKKFYFIKKKKRHILEVIFLWLFLETLLFFSWIFKKWNNFSTFLKYNRNLHLYVTCCCCC